MGDSITDFWRNESGLFDEYSDIIERVTFWNLHDGQSWLNYFPWRRVNYPLLFDRNRRPKPVFNAVYECLTAGSRATRSSTHAALPRRDENSRIGPPAKEDLAPPPSGNPAASKDGAAA